MTEPTAPTHPLDLIPLEELVAAIGRRCTAFGFVGYVQKRAEFGYRMTHVTGSPYLVMGLLPYLIDWAKEKAAAQEQQAAPGEEL
jgi:hypothetical protein